MEYRIRKAKPSDIDEIVALCGEHAEYERADFNPEGKAEKLAAFLFSETPPCECLIVENESGILGYATFMKEFSTWDADYYYYMDCLYLRPFARGYGIGEALVKIIAQKSIAEECLMMQWHTPVFNERAIKFYYRIGATSKDKTRLYMNDGSIKKLAQ